MGVPKGEKLMAKKRSKQKLDVKTRDASQSAGEEQFSPVPLENILKALSNPVRLKILQRLSHGDKYILQLVKEMGGAQQLIHRHLNVLESLGLVRSYVRRFEEYKDETDRPSRLRKYFTLDTAFILNVEINPHLFAKTLKSFSVLNIDEEFPGEREKYEEIDLEDREETRLARLSTELAHLKGKIKAEQKKQEQSFVEHYRVQKRINAILMNLSLSPKEYDILSYLVGESSRTANEISKKLNIHPDTVDDVLESLQDKVPLKQDGDYWMIGI